MRKIISIHVPKAAGSSFRLVLNRLFGSNNVAPLNISGQQFLDGPWRIMHGHFQLDNWKDKDVDLISMLRDPIQRYLSYYNFWKYKMPKSHGNPNFKKFIEEDKGFVDFLKYDFMHQEGFEYVRPELKDRFKFIGTVKHFQKSVDKLASIYGLPTTPVDAGRANATPRQLDWQHLSDADQNMVYSILGEELDFYDEIEKTPL